MNILVVGNGFDLAHGLPTKYQDFLDFTGKQQDFGELWEAFINRNIWLEYFREQRNSRKETWIDFENEILHVIRSIENDIPSNTEDGLDGRVIELTNPFFHKNFAREYGINQEIMDIILNKRESGNHKYITFRELRDVLLQDLNRLICAFEMYLKQYVMKQDILLRSPDIQELEIDGVLSFNYTDTYELLYADPANDTTYYDFIHGRVGTGAQISSNDMVLGIDEYLTGWDKDNKVEFIAFKKFYQRIQKETGSGYRIWLDAINDSTRYRVLGRTGIQNQVYIFGHSLDTSDRDVLRALILNADIHTTIYYANADQHDQQIANLVKVIGQDELIRRTGGTEKSITFKRQQEMKELKKVDLGNQFIDLGSPSK